MQQITQRKLFWVATVPQKLKEYLSNWKGTKERQPSFDKKNHIAK
jgi:hypothetical protein